jgi:phosphoglycerate dehydrogenase-like enzyme
MRTLLGATMGVIGLGGIGREVARLSRAAGMRVIGTRRSVTVPLADTDGADLVRPAGQILEVAGRPPRPEFTGLPQILLTPHISVSGDTNMAEPLRRLFADNLRRYLDGQPLLNVVDRTRGY